MMQSNVSKTTAIIYKASNVLNDEVVYVLYCSLVLLCMMQRFGATHRTNVLP